MTFRLQSSVLLGYFNIIRFPLTYSHIVLRNKTAQSKNTLFPSWQSTPTLVRYQARRRRGTHWCCPLHFLGLPNNYLADVVSMAAITPGRRAPHPQWGKQSVLCLQRGATLQLLIQSSSPQASLSTHSQIRSLEGSSNHSRCHGTKDAIRPNKGQDRSDPLWREGHWK